MKRYNKFVWINLPHYYDDELDTITLEILSAYLDYLKVDDYLIFKEVLE